MCGAEADWRDGETGKAHDDTDNMSYPIQILPCTPAPSCFIMMFCFAMLQKPQDMLRSFLL